MATSPSPPPAASHGVDDQIAELRRIGDSRAVVLMAPVAALVAVGCLGALAWVAQELPRVLLMFVGGCAVLVALAGLVTPHARWAAAGTRRGRREPAMLVLATHDEDSTTHARGVLVPEAAHARAWHMDLVALRWRPPAGAVPVQAVYLSDVRWPVLLLHADGLMWPRAKPRKAERAEAVVTPRTAR